MSSNPFEATDGAFLALRNKEGQYSLWPDFVEVPAGWESCFGPAPRDACLNFIEQHWLDMRPASLVREMEPG